MMMWMPQKLRDSGYSLKGDEPLKGGELNLNILIENQKGELFCLRRKKRNNRRAVDAYLRALYPQVEVHGFALASGGGLYFVTYQAKWLFLLIALQSR